MVVFAAEYPAILLRKSWRRAAAERHNFAFSSRFMPKLPVSRGGLDGSALYLYSEFPFPFRRLHQLSRSFHQSNPDIYANHNDNHCDHVHVQNVHSVDHLFDIMSRLNPFVGNSKTRFPLKLIVLDSVAALFRSEFDNTPSDLRKRSSLFLKISAKLKELANKFDLAIVITNQVTDLVESSDGLNGLRIGNLRYLYSSGRRVVPALGLAWANCVNSRFFISRSDDSIAKDRRENDESGPSSVFRRSQRRFVIVFSPYLPGTSCEFMITREGICAVQALVISVARSGHSGIRVGSDYYPFESGYFGYTILLPI